MDIFSEQFLPHVKAATISYSRWRRQQPGEARKWDAYLEAVLAHEKGRQRPLAPALSTHVGKYLLAAAELHMSVIDLGAVWPSEPPPEPPPEGELPAPSPDGIVMSADLTAGPTAADYTAAATIGFRVYRKEINDARTLGAAQHGIMMLPIVYGQGDTYHGGSSSGVVAAVNRYARGGTFWDENPSFPESLQPLWFEIGNEPYLQHETMWPTVATWAQGWYTSAVAAKTANSSVKVILPCGDAINGPQGWRRWSDYVLDAEPRIAEVMDAWSCHPYCRDQDPASWTDRDIYSNDFQRYNIIREGLAARGVVTPWCITEFGYHTGTISGRSVSEATQATYLGRAYDLLVSGGAGGMPKPFLANFFTIRDTGTDTNNLEHIMGFHFDYARSRIKPASAVLQGKAT